MPRMMTTPEAAVVLGVARGTIYQAIKRTGMRWHLQKVRGAYVFSNDDVIALAQTLKMRNLGHLVRTLTPNAYVRDTSHAR
jgi:excisionase family DNA binding protein